MSGRPDKDNGNMTDGNTTEIPREREREREGGERKGGEGEVRRERGREEGVSDSLF